MKNISCCKDFTGIDHFLKRYLVIHDLFAKFISGFQVSDEILGINLKGSFLNALVNKKEFLLDLIFNKTINAIIFKNQIKKLL